VKRDPQFLSCKGIGLPQSTSRIGSKPSRPVHEFECTTLHFAGKFISDVSNSVIPMQCCVIEACGCRVLNRNTIRSASACTTHKKQGHLRTNLGRISPMVSTKSTSCSCVPHLLILCVLTLRYHSTSLHHSSISAQNYSELVNGGRFGLNEGRSAREDVSSQHEPGRPTQTYRSARRASFI
jgi:hypothetical protein